MASFQTFRLPPNGRTILLHKDGQKIGAIQATTDEARDFFVSAAEVSAELAAWVRRCVPHIDHPSDPDRAVLRTILAKIEG